jgi:D-alanine--poly(phosphoribitol) ligase subunit 1
VSLIERIDAWGRLAPGRLAHVSGGRQLTYAELVSGSDSVAAFIARRLGHDRSPVVVLGHKEPEMLLAFLGSVKAGHAYVPLDSALPRQRIERVASTSETRLVLTPESVRAAVRSGEAMARPTGTLLQGDDAYYVMFTSGSTGEPKGVVITLNNLTSFVDWMLEEQSFSVGNEVFLNQAPFSFDLSVMDTYLSLVTGGTLFSLSATQIANPDMLYRALEVSQATTWVSTPSFAQLCAAAAMFDARMLPNARRFLFCGETLSNALATKLLERFPGARVWNTYGPTETTVATTSVCIDHAVVRQHDVLPVGVPKPDCRIRVVHVDGHQPQTVTKRGEIVISGPNVSPGYLNRPDLSRDRFIELEGCPAYRTGDVGHFEGDLLFFDGRSDDQVKLRGYRIELGDVESNLRLLTGVHEAVVIPLSRDNRVVALAAFVSADRVPGESEFDTGIRLRKALSERVPTYMIPQVIQLVEQLPLTPNGKVDRPTLARTLDAS